jgi:tetratricopeptide (TPR) repeat protein
MTEKRRSLLHRRDSTRHFLFSKTDPQGLKPQRIQPRESTWKKLKQLFPDVLAGKRFSDHAIKRLETSAEFGAMALKFDSLESTEKGLATYKAITQALDVICKKDNGWWGILEHGLLGSYFPGKDIRQCTKLAQHFQKSLKNHTKQTVTIGIAVHPTLRYAKHHIMDNARKAMVHAAFFGPGSVQEFDAVSLNISADRIYETGNIKGAIEEFKCALQLEPANVNVHNSLGVCFGVQGDYETAINEFKSVIELEPKSYMALYNLGLVSMLNGHRDNAFDLFLEANTIAEDVFEIPFQAGRLCLENGNPDKAKKFLKQALKINPNAGGIYRYLGDSYAASGQADAAIAAYKKAVKHNPGDATSLSALGCLFDEQGENPEIAIMFCRESVGLSPENGLFRQRLGKLYLKQNELEEALKQFTEADNLGHRAADVIQEIKNQMKTKAS